jgi:Holliday junction DNA helicase RuvB
VRDVADVKANGIVHQAIAHEALSELKVDELGLEQLDREYLSMMTRKFGGGSVGLTYFNRLTSCSRSLILMCLSE